VKAQKPNVAMQNDRPILIAGGGPVGCIAALALARQSVRKRADAA